MIKKIGYNRLALYILLITLLLAVNFLVGSEVVNTEFPWYSNISIFLLININIILLLVVLLLIFKHLGKLLVDRKRNLFGTRLQTKLVIFSITLAVIPVFIVYVFSSAIVNNSIDKWFDAQIEQALKSSIDLMQKYQNRLEQDIIEQGGILSQLVTSKGYIFKKNEKGLMQFMEDYTSNNRVDGIAIYNNQQKMLGSFEKSDSFFVSFVSDENVKEILEKKQVARYEFFGFDQLYWVGHPIYSDNNDNIAVGALFLYRKVPLNEAEKVSKIYDSYKAYSQIKFYADPVKNSYKILLILMTLIVVFAGIWGSLIFARGITEPIEKLVEASAEVSKGNLNIEIDTSGRDEIGFLLKSFSSMVSKLDEHNTELNLKNDKLSEMFMQIAKDNRYIDTIFKNVRSGIFLYDSDMDILKTNSFAESIIKENPRDYEFEILSRLKTFMKSHENKLDFQIEMAVEDENTILSVSVIKLYGSEGFPENIIMVMDDVTDIVHFQRISIWKEIATRIAHEIKNPLTPIKLTAERVRKRSLNIEDEKERTIISDSMDTIITEVDELQNLLHEFNMFARLPELKKTLFELNPFLSDVIGLYDKSHLDIKFRMNCKSDTMINADRNQLKRVFINLIDNALHAIKNHGNITIDVEDKPEIVKIIFQDDGYGITQEELSKIFVPYFSKKPDGTGLGLAIVKKIISEHHGEIKVESEYGKYTKFTIELRKSV